MPISSDDASWWTQLAGLIAGGFSCFVGGIVSATWLVARKVHGFEARLVALEVASDKDLPVTCATNKALILAEVQADLQGVVDHFHQTWGVELAGAREQRRNQEEILKEVQSALIRLHERIDAILMTGTSTGREEKR